MMEAQNIQNNNETAAFVVLQKDLKELTTTNGTIDPNKIDELSAFIEQMLKYPNKVYPLKRRDVLPIAQELEQQDRNDFDDVVLEAFGIREYKQQIKQSLIQLYTIRL